jgi:hypothetical protein
MIRLIAWKGTKIDQPHEGPEIVSASFAVGMIAPVATRTPVKLPSSAPTSNRAGFEAGRDAFCDNKQRKAAA